MPVYLPTPETIGSRLFCLLEISNFEKLEYAYLTILLGKNKRTVVFYKYPPEFAAFMRDISGWTPIHSASFTQDRLILFDRNTQCPCRDC